LRQLYYTRESSFGVSHEYKDMDVNLFIEDIE